MSVCYAQFLNYPSLNHAGDDGDLRVIYGRNAVIDTLNCLQVTKPTFISTYPTLPTNSRVLTPSEIFHIAAVTPIRLADCDARGKKYSTLRPETVGMSPT